METIGTFVLTTETKTTRLTHSQLLQQQRQEGSPANAPFPLEPGGLGFVNWSPHPKTSDPKP